MDKREILIEINSHPFNKDKAIDSSFIKANGNLENCIDNYDIFLKVENDVIVDCSYKGEGCIISNTATSLLLKSIYGLNIKESSSILSEYAKLLEGEDYNKELLGDLKALEVIYIQTSRYHCAKLPLIALKKLIIVGDVDEL